MQMIWMAASNQGRLARGRRTHRLDGSASTEVHAMIAGRLTIILLLRHRQVLGLALFAIGLGQRQRWWQALHRHVLGEFGLL